MGQSFALSDDLDIVDTDGLSANVGEIFFYNTTCYKA
jgi:hypothetical protein